MHKAGGCQPHSWLGTGQSKVSRCQCQFNVRRSLLRRPTVKPSKSGFEANWHAQASICWFRGSVPNNACSDSSRRIARGTKESAAPVENRFDARGSAQLGTTIHHPAWGGTKDFVDTCERCRKWGTQNPPLPNRFRGTFRDAFAATRFTFAGMCFVTITFVELSRATQKLQNCTFATLSRRALLQPLSPHAFAGCRALRFSFRERPLINSFHEGFWRCPCASFALKKESCQWEQKMKAQASVENS